MRPGRSPRQSVRGDEVGPLTRVLALVLALALLYPIAVAFDEMALFGFIEMVLFIVPVFVAYVYVWRRGGLDWD